MFIGEIYCAAAETFSLISPDRMHTASNWQRTQYRMRSHAFQLTRYDTFIHTMQILFISSPSAKR